jgi:flagellar motor protein MotB
MLVCNICGRNGERFDDSSRVDDRRAQVVIASLEAAAPREYARRFDFVGMATRALIAGNSSDASLPLAAS